MQDTQIKSVLPSGVVEPERSGTSFRYFVFGQERVPELKIISDNENWLTTFQKSGKPTQERRDRSKIVNKILLKETNLCLYCVPHYIS